MLQRSPTYIVSLPARDAISAGLRKVLPAGVVYKLARARNIGIQRAMYAPRAGRARTPCEEFRRQRRASRLAGLVGHRATSPRTTTRGTSGCAWCPTATCSRTIREGSADVVTDRIATFTATGIQLESGRHLDADVIVTATGLDMQLLGGGGNSSSTASRSTCTSRLTYKGVLLEGVPNAAIVFGYINASWTLKADLAAEYVCRLLNHMDKHGYTQAVAHGTPEATTATARSWAA